MIEYFSRSTLLFCVLVSLACGDVPEFDILRNDQLHPVLVRGCSGWVVRGETKADPPSDAELTDLENRLDDFLRPRPWASRRLGVERCRLSRQYWAEKSEALHRIVNVQYLYDPPSNFGRVRLSPDMLSDGFDSNMRATLDLTLGEFLDITNGGIGIGGIGIGGSIFPASPR